MKKTKLVASCLAVGIFAISASVQAASRTQTAVPLGERFLPTDTTRTAGPGLVYSNIEPGGSFFPQQPADLAEQAEQGVADDMILAPGNARELISYAAIVHQRSAEGSLGFTVHMKLQEDDGTGAESLPLSGLNAIDGTQCSIPNIHGLARPDEGFAECIPNEAGDSGIVIGDKVWISYIIEGGCVGANQADPGCTEPGPGFFGPGGILTAGEASASVGSTEPTLVQQIGDLQGLFGFSDGQGLTAECKAGVPAPVPTVSEWGMVLIAMLVLTGGTIVLRRSRNSVATA